MNPPGWQDAVERLQRNLDPSHRTVVNNNMESTSRSSNDWDTCCQYSQYTDDEPQSSMRVNLGSRELRPPSYNFCVGESEGENPDGEPFEMQEDKDPELSRKMKELRKIEEEIMRRKAAIALKNVGPFGKETSPPGLPCKQQSGPCKGAALKERVNVILHQRNSLSFLSKVCSPRDRMKSSCLSKGGLLQEDHPLKLRVKALMRQRSCDLCALPRNREDPDVTPPLPSQSVTSTAKKENSVNQGFQRFLSVLNEGVDLDFLRRIVNDDSEDLSLGKEPLNIQPPAVESKSDVPFRSQSQRSNSGASLLDRSRTSSGERKIDLPSPERRRNERLSLPGDDEKKNDRAELCLGSSSRSRSPPAVKKKKKEEEEEEEEKPNVDEKHVQLQNILKSLGLSLEVDEMSKLADRTQERLYGKRDDDVTADSRGEQESQQCRNSSSSSSSSPSSSSSSSRSTSRSCSSSPSRRRRSHNRRSKRRRRRSRDRSRDGRTCQDGSRDSKKAQTHRDRETDGRDSRETPAYQHPNPQNEPYPHPHPHPAAFPTFPQYGLPQYSHYSAHHSGSYSAAAGPYWAYSQGAILSSLYPRGHPYPQNTYHHFPGSRGVYPLHWPRQNADLLVNPDLSVSEGQGSASGPRCLQVVCTKQPATQSRHMQLTEGYRWSREIETLCHNQKLAAEESADSEVRGGAPWGDEEKSEAEQSDEEKQQPTEEEIKANLRKKLEAFNQKVKQKVPQPVNSLTSDID